MTNEDDTLNVDSFFGEDEPPTQRDALRMDVLNMLSDLEAETGAVIRLLQNDGFNPSTKSKAAYSLIKINRLIRSIEDSFGVYRFTAPAKESIG